MSVAEMVVAIFVGLVVLAAILAIVQVATHNQDRVARHVAANQRARPVMTRIMDRLHSACVAPGVAPVLEGSSDSELRLLSKSGSDVSPIPDRHVVTLTGSTLSESIYAGTGGEPQSWTFSNTPTTRELLAGVGTGSVEDPPTPVPVFRYFTFDGGQVSSTPLQTPLSTEDAARTVQVNVAFAVSPSAAPATDPKAPITLSDSATLRLEPASEDFSEVNLPCA